MAQILPLELHLGAAFWGEPHATAGNTIPWRGLHLNSLLERGAEAAERGRDDSEAPAEEFDPLPLFDLALVIVALEDL